MGAVKKKREIPFGLFYLKYFAGLSAGILAVAALVVFVFEVIVINGFVYPAYAAQEQAETAADAIAAAETVDESLIPGLCRYVLFDADGRVQAGNLDAESTKNAWRAVQEEAGHIGEHYYTAIARDGEFCVLAYDIIPQYRSALLRRYLPGPQNLLLLGGLCGILLVVLLTAVRFGRAMKKQLEPMIAVAENIQRQELEFSVEGSGIREIAAVLRAMDEMRAALKESLESQWRQEQAKREQTLALAHDLKTPLTLVRGNADLLCETALSKEQRECVDAVEINIMQMHNYVQTLVEITRDGYRLRMERIAAEDFVREVAAQAKGLCAVKGLRLEISFCCEAEHFFADHDLLLRALTNVLSNAVEYTPEGGNVFFVVSEEKDELVFSVTDTGKGFSAQALRRGTEQFFMDDAGRSSREHYGVGLYMVARVMEQHQGTLVLENDGETGGARVVMAIPREENRM